MVEEGMTYIWAGNPNPIHEAYGRSMGVVVHPLSRIKAVIDACRRSSLFVSNGHVRAANCNHSAEIKHPRFKLKEEL